MRNCVVWLMNTSEEEFNAKQSGHSVETEVLQALSKTTGRSGTGGGLVTNCTSYRRVAFRERRFFFRRLLSARTAVAYFGNWGQELLYLSCNFSGVCFQREMAGVVEMNTSLRLISLERLCARRQEERIVLPPNRQQRR